MQRGTAGYVPKSRCTELLRDTIEHVVEITRTESSFERLIDCATLSQFEFSFDNDFALIATTAVVIAIHARISVMVSSMASLETRIISGWCEFA